MSRPPGEARGIGKIVQAARLEHGWSQAELARAARLSRPTVSRVERGENPSMKTTQSLADALGLSITLSAEQKD